MHIFDSNADVENTFHFYCFLFILCLNMLLEYVSFSSQQFTGNHRAIQLQKRSKIEAELRKMKTAIFGVAWFHFEMILHAEHGYQR